MPRRLTGKQIALVERWEDLYEQVTEHAEFLRSTTGFPDPAAAQMLVRAHEFGADLKRLIERMRGK